MRNSKGQYVKGGDRSDIISSNNPNWTGGLPNCLECGKQLISYGAKWCTKHRMSGVRNWKWKGGKETEKERAVFYQQKREARKKGNGGSYTLYEWNELVKKFNYMCLCCKRYEPEIKLSVDHIVPISKGGLNTIQNIQPLCFSCNARKQAKHIDYISQYYEVNQPTV
jgi:5-methylcytosine-specific restriction endonuclease McrA